MLKRISSPALIFCIGMFLVFPVCISYQLPDPFITPRVIMIAAMVVLLVIILLTRDENQTAWLVSMPVISLFIFLVLYAIAVSQSLNPGDAWYEWMKTFLVLPVLLLSAVLLRDPDIRNLMLKFSQVMVMVLSAIYIYQWLKNINDPSLDRVFGYRLHIASTLGNKNFYGEVICGMLVFSVISVLTFKKFWKYLSLTNILLLIFSLVTVRSVSAFAAVLLAGLITVPWYIASHRQLKISVWKLAVSAGAVVVLIFFIFYQAGWMKGVEKRGEQIQQYLQHPELVDSTSWANNNSTFERLMLWRNSIELIGESPVTGCGVGNWKLLYPKFGVGGTRYIEAGHMHYEHPHNDYLHIASEAGLPALLAFIMFLLSLTWKAAKKISNHHHRLWFAGILFGVLCFSITSMFSFPRLRFYAWMQLAVFGGLLFAVDAPTEGQKKFHGSFWKALLLVCGCIAAWTLYAGLVRYKGETHSKLVQISKRQKNFARLVRESERADSWYNPIDETATPFTWYKGMALFYSGQIGQAKISYEDALQKNPYHIQLLNDLATACEQTNERERAAGYYRRALEVTPNFPHSLLNLSACYFNLGKKDSAYFFIDKLYGIRLSYQEQMSYHTFLPVILRQKIYTDSLRIPADIRTEVFQLSGDTSFVKGVYRKSRKEQKDFMQSIADSLRR